MLAKYPEKGKVKSRLLSLVDAENIVRLYRAFILDLLERLAEGDYRFRIAYDPFEKEQDFRKEFGEKYLYVPQTGSDLGRKMQNAFATCFSEGIRYAVLIGSDSPDLPKRFIEKAFQMLESDGVVIGPSYDGGYYLIGFSSESFFPGVFDEIPWGTENVCEKSVQILGKAGIHVHKLPLWRDIDRPEDIAMLIDDSKENGFTDSRTMAVLRDEGFVKQPL